MKNFPDESEKKLLEKSLNGLWEKLLKKLKEKFLKRIPVGMPEGISGGILKEIL